MVTTRGRIGDKLTEEELNDDDTITVYVPSSPKKRKQATKSSQSADIINQTITTPIAKKQKVAAHDDDGQNSNTCIVVEIPAKNKASLEDKQKVEILEEGSNKSSTSKTLNPEAPKGDRGTSSKKHRNGIAQLDGPWDEDREYTDDEDHVYMKTPEKIKQDLSALEAGSRKPVYAPGIIRHKSGRDTIDMSQSYASNSDDERFNSTQATASLSATKTKQQRFGNNEPEKEIVSTASQQIEQNEESSGDDAPEEMTAQVRDKGKGVATAPVQQ
jgi:hypothetical protein